MSNNRRNKTLPDLCSPVLDKTELSSTHFLLSNASQVLKRFSNIRYIHSLMMIGYKCFVAQRIGLWIVFFSLLFSQPGLYTSTMFFFSTKWATKQGEKCKVTKCICLQMYSFTNISLYCKNVEVVTYYCARNHVKIRLCINLRCNNNNTLMSWFNTTNRYEILVILQDIIQC